MPPNYRESLFGGQQLFTRNTSPPAGQQTQQRAGAGTTGGATGMRNAQQAQPMQTFSQLQQQGVARPAPPPPQFQQYGQYGGSQQAQQTRGGLQQQVQQAMANPGRYNSQAYQQIESAARQGMDANYQRNLAAMNQDMARRGLYDSTYAGQNWQDITRGYQTDIASLNAQLLQDAAATNAQDQLATQQMGLNFANLAGSQDLAEFEANRVAQAMNNEQALAQAQFGQNQYEFDRGQGLQAAIAGGQLGNDQQRLMLEQMLGMGSLGLQGRELDMRGQQFQQGLQFEGEQNALQRQLQQTLQGGELGLGYAQLGQQGALQGRELDLRAQQLMQQAALDGRSLDLQAARDMAQQQQFQQGLQFEGQQNDLQRQLQQFLQGNELGFNREQLNQQGQQFQQQLGFEGAQNDLQRQLQQLLQGNELGFNREQLAQQGQQFGQNLSLDQQRLAQQGQQFQQGLQFEGQQNELQRMLQQMLQGNELGFNREQLAQQGQQFDRSAQQADLARAMQERLATQEMSGYMGDGRRTVARDQATADADLARQNLLATLLGALGLNVDDFMGQNRQPPPGSPPPSNTPVLVPPPPPTMADPYNTGSLPQDTNTQLLQMFAPYLS